ncbi:MAG: helix-turn-helix transcriptional regulator [Myxococcota bacterium]
MVVRPAAPKTERLTPREREVLAGVARGWSTDRIARELGVLPSTVRTHAEQARGKLGARTRAEAVVRAMASRTCPIRADPLQGAGSHASRQTKSSPAS